MLLNRHGPVLDTWGAGDMIRTAIVLVAIGLAAILAGCAGATATPIASAVPVTPGLATPPPAAPATPAPATAAPATAPPAGGAPGSASPSFSIPSFSLPSADKDLEGRLPDAINGVKLLKLSFKGTDFLGSGNSSSKDLTDVLASLGKTPADLSIAVASDATGQLEMSLGAFRIAGADANTIITKFISASQKDSPDVKVSQANVGGKTVTQVDDPNSSSGPSYFYSSGDTVFFVETVDPALAAAAIATFP